MVYKTKGVCSQLINVVENNIVTSVEFVGGCKRQHPGCGCAVEGMDVHGHPPSGRHSLRSPPDLLP